MATAKREYPIRLDISQQGPAKAAPRKGGAHGAGAAIRSVGEGATRGLLPRALASIPVVGPLVAPAFTQSGRVAARDFLDGLLGNPKGGARSDPKTFRSNAPIEDIPDPVGAARAAGQAAGPQAAITPYDRQLAFLDTVFQQPLTMREAQAYSGMLPARDTKTQTAKDALIGETAKLSQSIFQSAVDQAQELAKTDPEGARAIVDKARSDYFNRQSGLVGFNPVQLAQAQLMGAATEED